jgi:hypothetical protein
MGAPESIGGRLQTPGFEYGSAAWPCQPPDCAHLAKAVAREHLQRMRSMRSMAEGLREFDVCSVPRPALAVRLGDGMARTGRTCQVRPCSEGRGWDHGAVHLTSVAQDGMQSFD